MSEPAPALALNRVFSPGDPSPCDVAGVVSHLAHELRQPLSTMESIAYYLEMILGCKDARVRVQVDKLRQQVQQMDWILSDAVHFLQASPPRPQVVDLSELISETVATLAREDQIEVSVEVAEEPELVRMDLVQARHLLSNLLTFFRRLSPVSRSTRLRSWSAGPEVVVEVETRAAVFSEAELHAMLQPFSPHLPAGSGLALASVQRIVEIHGGRMDLQSDPDTGTLLRLVFPAAA